MVDRGLTDYRVGGGVDVRADVDCFSDVREAGGIASVGAGEGGIGIEVGVVYGFSVGECVNTLKANRCGSGKNGKRAILLQHRNGSPVAVGGHADKGV